MAATTTITAPPTRPGVVRVVIEDDPTPLARLVGRTLQQALHAGHAQEVLETTVGTAVVRSHDTPQVATIAFGGGTIDVASGARPEPGATLVVDLNARFALTQEPEGDGVLAAAARQALTPPVPHWREAARRFWAATRDIPGIPDVLVVEATGPDGSEHDRFGDGTTTYGLAGPADLLAGVFSGADDLLVSLAAGVQIQGTLSQLSVMTAASWKVRFDV